MVIGIDVYHDVTSSSTGQKSVAGFVASINRGKYYMKVQYTGVFVVQILRPPQGSIL